MRPFFSRRWRWCNIDGTRRPCPKEEEKAPIVYSKMITYVLDHLFRVMCTHVVFSESHLPSRDLWADYLHSNSLSFGTVEATEHPMRSQSVSGSATTRYPLFRSLCRAGNRFRRVSASSPSICSCSQLLISVPVTGSSERKIGSPSRFVATGSPK